MKIPRFAAIPLACLFLMLTLPPCAEAYIGPGAGFAFLYSFFVIFIIIFIAPFFLLIWPIYYIIHKIKTGGGPKNARVERVVILGLDGLDPLLTQKFIAQGKLPHFQALAEEGCFHQLGTTAPSVSPVAWSSFQTGVNPAKHNIFDFLDRDKNTYAPILSSAFIGGARDYWKIGKFKIPRGKAAVRLLRKSVPFWKILGEKGVFSTILRVPITFPPEKFFGNSISGMCVPDLRGTQGTFTVFSTEKSSAEHTGGMRVEVLWNGDAIDTFIPGPIDTLSQPPVEMKIPLRILHNGDGVKLRLNGKSYLLKQGEYSPWLKLNFSAGAGMKAAGICRFCLIRLQPELTLYMTPINIDPEKPSLPISHPLAYSVYLAKLQGPFATLGLAEDTWALNEGILDDRAFHQQVWLHHQERETMWFQALKMTRKGVVACVFDTSDRIQHMFWRYIEENHPANRLTPPDLDFDPLEHLYIQMDDLLRRSRARLRKNDLLMVISDHGFKSFRRCFNLNAWLRQNGYLHLKEGHPGGDFFQGVDWEKTRAYGVGLGGFFINLKGREKKGAVAPGEEYQNLRNEIKQKLTGLIDSQTGETAIECMYLPEDLGSGPYSINGPNLIFGFNPGYRISWDSVTGDTRGEIFSDNIKKWSGDHCIDYKKVKGIFFSNHKIELEDPELKDIAPTLLDLFGLPIPEYMDGKPLMKNVRVG